MEKNEEKTKHLLANLLEKIEDLVKQFPNDADLGEQIRLLIRNLK